MTIIAEWKKCPECHKKYSWNPDLGRFRCPHCGGLGKKNEGPLDLFLGNKKKDK